MATRNSVALRRSLACSKTAEHTAAIAEHLNLELPEKERIRVPDAEHAAMVSEEHNELVLRSIREHLVGPIEEPAQVEPDVEVTETVEETDSSDTGDEVVEDADVDPKKTDEEVKLSYNPDEKFMGQTLGFWASLPPEEFAKHSDLNRSTRKIIQQKLGRVK